MSKTRRLSIICFFSALIATISFCAVSFVGKTAYAGSERIQIFRDTFSEDEIDDFKWNVVKGGDSVIEQGGISNEGAIVMKSSTSWNVIKMKDTIRLAAGEKLEMTFTVDNAKGLFVMPSFNPADYYENGEVANPFGGLRFFVQTGLSVNNVFWNHKPDIIAPHMWWQPYALKGADNTGDGYDAYIGQNSAYDESLPMGSPWSASDTHIGDDGWTYSTPVMFRAVYHADGSIYYYIKQTTDAEWATLCIVKSGVKVLAHGYDDVGYIQSNAGKITTPDDPAYDQANGDWTTTGGPVMQGVDAVAAISLVNVLDQHNLSVRDVSVAKYDSNQVKTTVSSDTDDWEAYGSDGRIFFDFVQPALIIDGAADDDYIIKKTPLSLPTNTLNPYFYDISFDAYAENLTGGGEGVIYVGATDTALAGAAEIVIKSSADKMVMVVKNGAEVSSATELPIDAVSKDFASLRIRNYSDGKNEVYVGAVKAAEFTKDLRNTYFAFGVRKNGGTAKMAVKNVMVYKYNYLQGTGADFTEDFHGGTYNADNLLIQVHPDYADPTTVYIEDGRLVLDDAYGVTVNTVETYSDFEFSFRISYMAPWEQNSVFGVAFGKPIAEAGECLVWLQFQVYGGFVVPDYPNSYIEYDRPNYHEWSAPAEEYNIYYHDYSVSPLTVKFVKQDTVMKVYTYTEEDSEQAQVPFQVYKDCFGFGCIDIRSLATGLHLTLTIDEITLKNLDVHKGEIATPDENNRQELILEQIVIEDPSEAEDPVNPIVEYNGGGCGSKAGGTSAATLTALALAAAFVAVKILRRRKTERRH